MHVEFLGILFFALAVRPNKSQSSSQEEMSSFWDFQPALRWGRRRFITAVMICAGVIGNIIGFSAGLPFVIVAGLCFVYCIAMMADSGSLTAGLVLTARNEERGRTMAIYSFVGFSMAFLAPLAFGGVLDIAGSGIVGWGLAFAALALVQMTGPIWLRVFRAEKDT